MLVHTHGHSIHLHLTGNPGDPGACSLKEWPLPLKPLSTLEVMLNSLRFRFTSEISERPGTCRCERYFKGERSWALLLPHWETLCWATGRRDSENRGQRVNIKLCAGGKKYTNKHQKSLFKWNMSKSDKGTCRFGRRWKRSQTANSNTNISLRKSESRREKKAKTSKKNIA